MERTHPDRDQLLELLQELRTEMTNRLDSITAVIQGADQAAPAAAVVQARTTPRKRRSAYRGAIVPTDIDRARARAVLKSMGLS